MLSRMIRSHVRYLFVFGVLGVVAGCSSISSNPQSSDIERKLPYACKASTDGQGWDCRDESGPINRIRRALSGAEIAAGPDDNDVADDSVDTDNRVAVTDSSGALDKPVSPADSVLDTQNFNQPEIEKLYSVQAGAFAGERQRDEFVAANRLPKALFAYRESIKDGRTWWVLTYGEYGDMAESNAAVTELRDQFGLTDTWVRPLAQLSASSLLPEDISVEKSRYYPLYGIQLAAFKTQGQRIRFMNEKRLAELNLVLAEEQRDGIKWWTLLYGQFESVQAAKIEQMKLEANYGLTGTWIKPRND